MGHFEEMGQISRVASERERHRDIRENIFDSIVAKKLLDTVTESMEDAEYEEDEIRQVKEIMSSLSDEDLKRFLSVPFEIRENFYVSLRADVLSKKTTFRKEILERIEKMKEPGYSLGYHISKFEIAPKTSGEKKEWNVVGYERDERDEIDKNDRRFMAYYSLDYKNFYRKKGGNFLYVIRAQTGKDTPHKQDLSNNWGRAPMLSVVGRMNLSDIDKEVEKIFRKKNPEE